MRLTDAHQTIAYAFSSGLVHLMLLAIEFTDHQKSTIPAWLKEGKGYGFRKCSDALQVPSEVLQLLAQTSLQRAFRPVPFHAQTKEISSSFLPIGPGFRYSRRSMSVEPSFSLMMRAPNAIRTVSAGAPRFEGNFLEYRSSAKCHGIESASLIHRLFRSSLPPNGR